MCKVTNLRTLLLCQLMKFYSSNQLKYQIFSWTFFYSWCLNIYSFRSLSSLGLVTIVNFQLNMYLKVSLWMKEIFIPLIIAARRDQEKKFLILSQWLESKKLNEKFTLDFKEISPEFFLNHPILKAFLPSAVIMRIPCSA